MENLDILVYPRTSRGLVGIAKVNKGEEMRRVRRESKKELKWLIMLLSVMLIMLGLYSTKMLFTSGAEAKTMKQEAKTTKHVRKAGKATSLKNSKKAAKKNDLKTAAIMAAQYDYQDAEKLLADENSDKADALVEKIEAQQEHLVQWTDPAKISHVFVHSLIVDPEKAFRDPQQAQGYKDYMVTIPEFEKMIDQLYKNNYVLVDYEDLVTKDDNGGLVFRGVALPEGKKPLIISQDDVNYYEYMAGAGFADNLMIDKDGKVKNLYTGNGKKEVGNYDMVPIIDEFVEKHPDFSYHGSKGVLAITGYNGALGYRSSISEYGDNEKTRKAIKQATEVADALKATGWTFASHSWGHINFTQASVQNIQQDTEKWLAEVAPILGNTNVLIFPFGADISGLPPYDMNNAKFAYLKSKGFDVYCNVDASTTAWGQFSPEAYRNARINVDGLRFDSQIKGQNTVLDSFFNTSEVMDAKARSIK